MLGKPRLRPGQLIGRGWMIPQLLAPDSVYAVRFLKYPLRMHCDFDDLSLFDTNCLIVDCSIHPHPIDRLPRGRLEKGPSDHRRTSVLYNTAT